jgi:hypothetical protein
MTVEMQRKRPNLMRALAVSGMAARSSASKATHKDIVITHTGGQQQALDLEMKSDQPSIFSVNHMQRHLQQLGRVVNCLTQSQFTISCYSNLIDDPNEDGSISIDEYTSYVERLTCNEFSGFGMLPSCGIGPSSSAEGEYVLPYPLQDQFIDLVCDHVTAGANNNDAYQLCVTSNFIAVSDTFTFANPNSNVYADIQTLCSRSYNLAIDSGVILREDGNCDREYNTTVQ